MSVRTSLLRLTLALVAASVPTTVPAEIPSPHRIRDTLLQTGTTLVYEALSPHHPERLELTIAEAWNNGLTWYYTYYDRGTLDAQGVDSIATLDSCRFIAPWTVPDTGVNRSCDFWLSPDQLTALTAGGKTYFYTDKNTGRGLVRLEYTGQTSYEVTINGALVSLPAISATSTTQDLYIILDDAIAPLILSSTNSGLRLAGIKSHS